jgi:Putative addiction module component
MTVTLETLREEARKLSPDERLELVDEILASLHPTDPEIDRLWATVARDRLDAYQRGEMTAKDFDEVMRKYERL